MTYRIAFLVVAFLVFTTGVAHSQKLTAEENKSLDQDLKSWLEAFNAHDSQRLAKEFTNDAELVSESGETTKGRAAIKAMFVKMFKEHPNIQNEISDVTRRKIAKKIVIEQGTFRASGMKNGQSMQGRYSATLVKRKDNWLVRHEQDLIPVPDAKTAEAEVQKANQKYEAIILANDSTGYEKLLSDDYVFIDTDSTVKNKADVLKEVATTKFDVAKSENVATRLYGNTAILTGIWIEKGTNNNEPFEKTSRFTTVFAKQDGSWKVVSDQLTEIKK